MKLNAARHYACSKMNFDVGKCSPADGTNAAYENEEDSARPLPTRLTGYLSLASMRKGGNGRYCEGFRMPAR
jgi:hypothetical protein